MLRTHGEFQSSVVHGLPFPGYRAEWAPFARKLAGCEVGSFAANYSGPELTLVEADELLRSYLS